LSGVPPVPGLAVNDVVKFVPAANLLIVVAMTIPV
jgi:hypothetical protein